MVFLNGSGTHKGEFYGTPSTKKSSQLTSDPRIYTKWNNLITGHWGVVDQLNLLKQTGV